MASKNLTLEIAKLQKRVEGLEEKAYPKITVSEKDRDFDLAGILYLGAGSHLVIRIRRPSQELRFSLIDSGGNNLADCCPDNRLLQLMIARDRASLD